MVSPQTSRRALFFLIVLSVIALSYIIAPLAKALILAAAFAGGLYPLGTWLTKKLHVGRSVAAGLITLGILLLMTLPVTGLAAFIISAVSDAIHWLADTAKSEGVKGLLVRLPDSIESSVRWIIERLPLDADRLSAQLGIQGPKALAALAGAGTLLFQATMMLIGLYAFLVEGERLVKWLDEISPLEPGQLYEILTDFKRTTRAVVISTAATASVQAAAAFVGFLIVRLPHPFLFMFLTFFVALIPAIGGASVCVVAALVLLAQGKLFWGIFLAVWGVLVVGLVDNIVKPLLVKRGLDLNGMVIFFALIGGLAAFGAIGLLVGPLAVAFFLTVVRIWNRSYGKGVA